MDVETSFREWGDSMARSMTIFSGDEQAAQDAVQQAFAKALLNSEALEQMPESAMKAWIYAAARNSLIDMKRKESRFIHGLDENFVYEEPDPTDKVVVHGLIENLPPHLKKPVCMKYYSQMNATEIGRVLGLPPATVRTRLKTAMAVMRNAMTGGK